MKTILMIICLSLFSGKVVSQTKEIVNPKGKWFFGVELGTNKINSSPQGESKTAFQGGFLAEYYFAKHWSLSGKIKYFETGVSFFQSGSSGLFGPGTDLYSGTFEGAVIAIPFSLKWEFRIYKNLGANLKMGYALNIETKSTYRNYSSNLSTDYTKQYGSLTPGVGLNYFINKKTALYFDVESFSGSNKGHAVNSFGRIGYNLKNVLMSFGIKHSFK
ncbi:outer membrane beta-barrel protein [Hyunsoonleella sp. SJ7]|uniref:Outer membrane beta-barrel protein n=1 Tax=Hyunsoonleella aquatilis TaxID=2762758 RepID=A0A923HA10_9FLAO|nr:outer membrane beta-barrel protein [Hyunsoonleella aquatilis]MBC3757229.1 outer membrane beta-barrel protein [Hyunsoonleella aquatilis]